MVQLGSRRLAYIAGGVALRIALLGFGHWQDTHSLLPYTDVDYSIYNGAASHLISSCPLELIAHVRTPEDYQDLADPPQAPGMCAQGYAASLARFVLQMQNEIMGGDAGGHRGVAGDGAGSGGPPMSNLEAQSLSTSLALLRPLLRLLAGLGNPFAQPTYRYTPWLAVLLSPAQLLGGAWAERLFGKLVCVLADVLIALLMWDVLDVLRKRAGRVQSKGSSHRLSISLETDALPGLLWLLNPFPAQIATRGSSESLVGVLVLAFIACLTRATTPTVVRGPLANGANGQSTGVPAPIHYLAVEPSYLDTLDVTAWSPAALGAPLFLALAVHLKLYPIIYGAPVLALLWTRANERGTGPLKAVVGFGAVAAYALIGVGVLTYFIFGPPYLAEAILYHLTRQDHRHNFSPSFLPVHLLQSAELAGVLGKGRTAASYLSPLSLLPASARQALVGALTLGPIGRDVASRALDSLAGFAPMLVVCGAIGFALGPHDFIAACTAQTIAFVALNKVVTSQYFMWFLWLLPIVAPSLEFSSVAEVVLIVGVWVGAQALWLSQAYLLEFQALDLHIRVWACSLVVLCSNVLLLARFLSAWSRSASRRIEEEAKEGERRQREAMAALEREEKEKLKA